MLSKNTGPDRNTVSTGAGFDTNPEEFLRRACENKSVAPAYIFIGSDEDAKKLAINFAKVLNCENNGRRPCGVCGICRKIESGTHPDVRWLELGDSQKSLSINEVRKLRSQIALRAYEARKKVFIIHKAHLMNQQSSNAILKTLEEPPEDSVIILLAESLAFMLKTIVSRCQLVKLHHMGVNLDKEPETLEEELDRALILLRDSLVFKVTRNRNLLFDAGGLKNMPSLSKTHEIARFESDIRKLIELKESMRFNANPKLVRDVFSNTMRRYLNV